VQKQAEALQTQMEALKKEKDELDSEHKAMRSQLDVSTERLVYAALSY